MCGTFSPPSLFCVTMLCMLSGVCCALCCQLSFNTSPSPLTTSCFPGCCCRYLDADSAMVQANPGTMRMLRGRPAGGAAAAAATTGVPRNINSDFARAFGPAFLTAFGEDGAALADKARGQYGSAAAFRVKAQEIIAPAKDVRQVVAGAQADVLSDDGGFLICEAK